MAQRFIVNVATAAKTLHEVLYQALPGKLPEGPSRLLVTNVKLYVAPMSQGAFDAAVGDLSGTLAVKESGKNLVTLDDLMPSIPGLFCSSIFEPLAGSSPSRGRPSCVGRKRSF